MFDSFAYDFGYSWNIAFGHLIPFGAAAAVALAGWWIGWRWVTYAAAVVGVWALAGLLITHVVIGINSPVRPPSARFLASGQGRVLDLGAGSGRASIGLLLARPDATVTALDIYDGYFGIEENTPERLLANAHAAGVADRIETRTADMRDLPFADDSFDGVISVAAVDHLPADGIVQTLGEVGRVLRPGGDFLLTIVDVDVWAWLASPHGIAHHPPVDHARWRTRLEQAGFRIDEEGKIPAAFYFLARGAE